MSKIAPAGKAQIAREIAFGIDKKAVASFHGLTASGLNRLINTNEMKFLVDQEREMMACRMAQTLVHFGQQMEASAMNVIAIANDLQHKDAYKANVDILQMFKPAESKVDQKIEINVNQEVITGAIKELEQLREVHAEFKPVDRLLEGSEAMPKAFSEELGDNVAVAGAIPSESMDGAD